MSQLYTSYEKPIALLQGYEAMFLSNNCFKKKIKPRITALLDTLSRLADVKTEARLLIMKEINILRFDGETIEQVMDRMIAEGKSWADIDQYLHLTTNLIFDKEV